MAGENPKLPPAAGAVNPMMPKLGRNGKIKKRSHPANTYIIASIWCYQRRKLTSLERDCRRRWRMMPQIQKDKYKQQYIQARALQQAAQNQMQQAAAMQQQQMAQMAANPAQAPQLATNVQAPASSAAAPSTGTSSVAVGTKTPAPVAKPAVPQASAATPKP